MHADIVSLIENDTYDALLRFARTREGAFTLIVRNMQLSARGHHVLSLLEPGLISNLSVTEWPGTQLLNHDATERRYRLDDDSVRVLTDSARSLFAWQQPDLPEDLAFYTQDGECWLYCIAHEWVACVDTDNVDVDELHSAVPGLQLRRHKRQS